jgi:hypothetical protein
MFPPTKSKAVVPKAFEYTLKDLIEEDFELRPTNSMEEHLTMDGKILLVFSLRSDSDSFRKCYSFQNNRLAKCLKSLPLYMGT